MRRLALLALLLATVALPAPAHAAPLMDGVLCNEFSWAAGTGTAEVYAGPLTLADDDPSPHAVTGTVVCSLQDDYLHSAPDLARAAAPEATGVAVLAPTVVPVDHDPAFMCTEVDVAGGGTWYYDDATGEWSSSANVWCQSLQGSNCPTSGGGCGDPCGGGLLEDCVLCPVFQAVFPPEGDITLPVIGAVWDCPPYGDVGPNGRA